MSTQDQEQEGTTIAGSFNSITIVGYVGRDPDMRTTPTGTTIAGFSMATNDRRGRDQEEVTTWFRISCFGRLAEIAEQYVHKGSHLCIQGSLSQEPYTDREGKERTSLEVRARDLQLLDRAGERNGTDTEDLSPPRRGASSPTRADSIPF